MTVFENKTKLLYIYKNFKNIDSMISVKSQKSFLFPQKALFQMFDLVLNTHLLIITELPVSNNQSV